MNINKPSPGSESETLGSVFKERLAVSPDAMVIYDEARKSITYHELDILSDNVVAFLSSKNIKKGDIVGVLTGRSVDLLIVALGIVKMGAIYLPLHPEYPVERLDYIMRDANTRLVLTSDSCKSTFSFPENNEYTSFSFINDAVSFHKCENELSEYAPVKKDDIAYVMYTSGSTGRPKGVKVSHKSVCGILSILADLFPMESGDKFLFKTNFCFDVSITEVFGVYFGQAGLVVLNDGYEKDPIQLARVINHFKITHINFVPTMLEAFLETVVKSNIKLLDSMKYFFIAGEAFSIGLLRTVMQCGIKNRCINLYGPTEATIYATYYRLDKHDELEKVPLGNTLPGVNIHILDEDRKSSPGGEIGEIAIGGVGVAEGYLNLAGITEEKFVFFKDQKVYLSGDLGLRREDGILEYRGRKDSQIKLRGYRIELGEIEETIQREIPESSAAKVVTHQARNRTSLVAYIQLTGSNVGENYIRLKLETVLPSYMVPEHIIIVPRMPYNTTGKIDVTALPNVENHLSIKSQVHHSFEGIEKEIAEIWKEILGHSDFTSTCEFFKIGGTSILAIRIINTINESYNIHLSFTDLFREFTIKHIVKRIGLANVISTEPVRTNISSRNVQADIPYYANKNIWLDSKLDVLSAKYNVGQSRTIQGNLDISAYEQAIDLLMAENTALRTIFIDDSFAITDFKHRNLEIVSSTDELEVKKIVLNEYKTVFDLSSGPLIRFLLILCDANTCIEVITAHHIICDGESLDIINAKINYHYNNILLNRSVDRNKKELSTLESNDKTDSFFDENENTSIVYWKEKLASIPPVIELPTDRPRPVVKSYKGGHLNYILKSELFHQIQSFAKAKGITVSTVLFAVFNCLLYKYTKNENIVVGVPVSTRESEIIRNQIGCFLNILVITTKVDRLHNFEEITDRVWESTCEGISHRFLPFDRLVDLLNPPRSTSYSPLFQVMYSYQVLSKNIQEMQGLLTKTNNDFENDSSIYDLSLLFKERGDELTITWEYSDELFEENSIIEISEQYEYLLEQLLSNPNKKISDIDYIPSHQLQSIQSVLTGSSLAKSDHTDILRNIFNFADNRADNVALEHNGNKMTYAELDLLSDNIAAQLVSKFRIRPGSLIAILLNKSFNYIAAMLGILKSGCCYLPLDVNYPIARNKEILSIADPALILSNSVQSEKFTEFKSCIKTIEELHLENNVRPLSCDIAIHPNSLAYVIFTSGSTGKPKGVKVTHNNLYLSTIARRHFYKNNPGKFLLIPSLAFDSSIAVIYWTLSVGGILELGSEGLDSLLDSIIDRILHAQISNILLVPSLYESLLDSTNGNVIGNLSSIIVAGEPCTRNLIRKHFKQYPNIALFNEYGPTEATVWCTAQEIKNDEGSVLPLIGTPIANVTLEILDNDLLPVPRGIPGELHICSELVADGYLFNDLETSKRFYKKVDNNGKNLSVFKTGDVVKLNRKNEIEYIGRLDRQIKISGIRIETHEIEHTIKDRLGLQKVIVVNNKYFNGTEGLICYFQTLEKLDIDYNTAWIKLKDRLLPTMIPKQFVWLSVFPTTSNGKIDYKALPAPAVQPADLVERDIGITGNKIREVWKKVLQCDSIGPDTNFFECGGSSILLIKLQSILKNEMAVELPITDYFNFPTIRMFADYLNEINGLSKSVLEPVREQSTMNRSRKHLEVLKLLKQKAVH